jgi:hypothetical protein
MYVVVLYHVCIVVVSGVMGVSWSEVNVELEAAA